MHEHPLIALSKRYPQLLLPVKAGMKDTQRYKDAVLKGKEIEGRPDFSLNEKDSLASVCTPAGKVDVLYLFERKDFEHAIQALAYRCEPKEIPASMGASTLSGLINWEKIRPHMATDEEFLAFTADKKNYLDTIIILSSGPYSAVSAEDMKTDEASWTDKSVTIRKYHELTHFYSRKLFIENKEAVRDEIIADMIGIISAFGFYDTDAARRFLGIEGDAYREGGRLQNYVEDNDAAAVMDRANAIIDKLSSAVEKLDKSDVFKVLEYVEKNKIGI